MKELLKIFTLILIAFFLSCSNNSNLTEISDTDDEIIECSSDIVFDTSRGDCNETLDFASEFTMQINTESRIISANSIPEHQVGLFGKVQNALNPNAISAQNETYTITTNPTDSGELTALLGANGPRYRFGVLLNGVELDPVAAEPFPHNGVLDPNVNWEWNLEALNVQLGLDCSNAHVQPSGQYHYHGKPTLYLENLNISTTKMTLIGYAADGFPIYYKYAYSDANDNTSTIIEMTSSYQLKTGDRPGDGITAPCGVYTGVYSADYEYVENAGTLDETNGRTGVTPEYPLGTFYYVLTDEFPSIPRYFRGTPSDDFGF
ncbi:YHYH protein [Polaribacter sargassicola]|uniref:YHYH protein n=1 Tax=Polaribacter sargassicola TaxID=2836891 RepID=UPI001F40E293|nr:YHYH protein [Polaribacter sp. DS7-9]MCG1036335.1 YHYH protein [Polaribacter sp. DS7-9]